MAKRMNVIFEEETAQTINRAAKSGERSRYINRAVQYFAATHGPEALRERLKQAALRDRDLAEEVARDWFAVDQAPWPTAQPSERLVKRRARKGARFIS